MNEGLNSTFTIFSLSVSSSHFKTYSHNSEYINIAIHHPYILTYYHCIYFIHYDTVPHCIILYDTRVLLFMCTIVTYEQEIPNPPCTLYSRLT